MTIQTDVLIVGAGVSGIAAAVATVKNNKNVLLIDNHPYPGGAATAVEVGTICGLFKNGKQEESSFLIDGFSKEFAFKIIEKCNRKPLRNQYGLHYLPYQKEGIITVMNEYIETNNIHFMPCTSLIEIHEKNGLLNKAIIQTKTEKVIVEFNKIIDCSGSAIVAKLIAHPLIESHYFQAASINFYVNKSKIVDDEISNFKLIRELKTIIQNYNLPDYYKHLFVIPGSLSKNRIGFKFTIPWEISHEEGAIDELTVKAKNLINEVFRRLKEYSTLFTDASIDHVADDLGWRTGKRPLGKYILTEEDVITGKKWEVAIAKSAWPIEEWLPNKSVDITFINNSDYYEIPKECLMSIKYDNLYFAGRIISATDRAIASARVMGVCIQTGYASGMLASQDE